MEFTKCPFNPIQDKDIPCMTVFDTLSVGQQTAVRVGAIIKWIVFNKNPNAARAVFNEIQANIGPINMQLFIQMYIRTYDRKKEKVLRYHPVKSEQQINSIFFIFRTIDNLIPRLQGIVRYYS